MWAAYRCVSCGSGSVAVAEDIDNPGNNPRYWMEQWVAGGQAHWFPRAAIGTEFPDVPAHIAGPAREATECLGLQHYRAAAILARAVVEAVTKDKQVTGRNLQVKIDELHNQNLIRAHTKEVAHEIRFIGNDMAHGDFEASIDPDEAEDVVTFMSEILEEIYQGPARLSRRQGARQAKLAAQSQGGQPASQAPTSTP